MYNGEFNGGFCKCKCIRRSGNEEVNYLASYRFMIKIRKRIRKRKNIYICIESRYSRINRYKLFKNPFNDGESTKEELFQNYSNANKKAFVFGVAMHTSTDTFAHSTYRYYNGTWYSITHAINEKKGQYKKNEADNSKFVPERFDMAYRAERNTLYRYQKKRLMLQYVMISMQQMIQINIIHQILRSK